MDNQSEKVVAIAFTELMRRVVRVDRIGLYETTYWFDDGAYLQVINFDEVPADNEGEESTLDHTLHLTGASFEIQMIGFYSSDWSCDVEEARNPEAFLEWHHACHEVVRLSGTD